MYSTPARKFLSVFMAAVLVLTCNSGTINPVTAWAETQNQSVQTQTADDQTDSATNGEGGSDAEQQPTVEQREAADVTDNADVLALTLAKLTYSIDDSQQSIAAEDNALDASGIDVSAASNYVLTYTAKATDELLAGDTVKVSLPNGALSVDGDRLAAADEAVTAQVATDGSGKQTVTFTLSAAVEKGQQVEFAVPVQLDAEQLGEEATTVTLPLPNSATATLTLPAAPAAENGSDEGEETTEDNADNGIAVASDDGVDAQAITYDATASTKVTWYDGVDSARQADGLNSHLKIYYAVGSGEYHEYDSIAAGLLGQKEVPAISTSDSANPYTYKAEGLPATTSDGTKISYIIIGEISSFSIGDNKYSMELSADGSYINVIKLKSFGFTLKMHNGTETWVPNAEELAEKLTVTDNSGNKVSISKNQISITDNGDGSYAVTIEDLPMYSSKDALGTEIGYKATLDETDRTASNDGIYSSEYNNAAVPNYGSDTTAVHEGGTIDYLRKADTAYNATKVWLDGNAGEDNRPDATFTLWRYVNDGTSTFRNAAQVLDASGKPVTVTAAKDQNSAELNIETVSGTALPKYNADGYEYIYLTRESMEGTNAGAYDQVFGAYDAEGGLTDTVPGRATREKGDVSVYNGGTVNNHLSGTVDATVTKSWVASAHQTYLQNYKTVMYLQARHAKADEGEGIKQEWYYCDSNGDQTESVSDYVKADLFGFASEITSKTVSQSMPKYDLQGYEMEYRWVEVTITQAGTPITSASDEGTDYTVDYRGASSKDDESTEGGVTTYTKAGEVTTGYNVKSSEGRQNEDYYTVTNTTVDSATESVNKLEGKVDYQVTKKWVDGNGDPIDVPTSASYLLWKDGASVATFEVGTAAEQKGEIKGNDGTVYGTYEVKTPSTGVQTITISDLAKYTDDGTLVSYFVSENGQPSAGGVTYVASYVYDNDNRSAEITNKPGTPGVEIRVEKQWLDDSDTASRLPVTFEISYTNPTTNQTVTTEAKVSESTNWFALVSLGKVEEVDKSSIKVVEKHVTDTDGTQYSVSYSDDEKTTGSLETKVGGKAADGYKYVVENLGHKGNVGGYENYVSTNRRVGTVNLTVTKTWNDTGADKDARPSADVVLSSSNDGVTVGENYVELEGDSAKHYIVGKKAAVSNPVEALIDAVANDDAPSTDDKTTVDDTVVNFTQNVKSTDDDTITVYYYGLPKYDMQGRVISYSVYEELGEDAAEKDYSGTVTARDYQIGSDYHFTDFQSVEVTNARSKTINLDVNKMWRDAYQKSLGHRSDLSLTLWESFQKADGTTAVQKYQTYGYKDYTWSTIEGDANWLKASFEGLPQYTADGAEITYYFEETYNNPKATTDYDYNKEGTSVKGDAIYLDSNNKQTTKAEAAHTLLKAGGTFINGISNTVNVEGEKVWSNIPSAIRNQMVLPNITVKIYQQADEPDSTKHLVATLDSSQKTGVQKTDKTAGANGFLNFDEKSNTWGFVAYYYGENDLGAEPGNPLPKYDELGNLYKYTIEETIPSTDSVDSDTWGIIYNENSTDFTAKNEYNNKNYEGQVMVTKNWSGYPEGYANNHPVITFTLHQMYKSGNSYIEVPEGKQSKAINVNDSGSNSATFSDLAIYAPDGTKYYYYVTESKVDGGYTSTLTVSGQSGSTVTATIDGVEQTLFQPNAGTASKNATGAVTTTPGAAVSVSATNTYSAGTFNVMANKYWSDQNNALGLRDNISVKITRTAANQSGNNGISQAETVFEGSIADSKSLAAGVQVFWLDKDAGNTSGKWVFEVDGLDTWAPDGKVWNYTITETAAPTGYNIQKASFTFNGSSVKDGNTLSLVSEGKSGKAIENNMNSQVSIAKTWANDSNNAFGTRPAYVKVKLQYTTSTTAPGNGTASGLTWQDATKANNENLYNVLKARIAAKDNVNTELGEDGTFMVSLKSTTTQSWSNLPSVLSSDASATNYLYYRIVEVTNEQAGVAHPMGGSATTSSDTLYNYDAVNGETAISDGSSHGKLFTTKVTNTLETTQLTITKAWTDDNNFYGLEGTTTFQLGYKSGTATEFTDSKVTVNASGLSEGKFTMNGEETPTAWTKTLAGLPKCDVNGNEYTWQAKETSGPAGYTFGTPANGGTAADGYTTSIANTMNTAKIKLVKKGEGAEETLKNITFNVTGKTAAGNNQNLFTWTAGADGTASLSNVADGSAITLDNGYICGLPAGTYTFTEDSSTTGNDTLAKNMVLKVTVGSDGKVSSATAEVKTNNGATKVTEGLVAAETTDDGTTLTLTDPKAKVAVTLNKTITGSAASTDGAKFKLFKADGTQVGDELTISKGSVSLGSLEVGAYYLQETEAPATAVCDTSAKYWFQVTNTNGGQVAAYTPETATDTDKGANADAAKSTLAVSNEVAKTDVTLKKTVGGKDNADFAQGTTFDLYKSTDGGKNYSEFKTSLVIGDAGTLTVSDLEVAKYYFKETSAPAGVELDATELKFEVTHGDSTAATVVNVEGGDLSTEGGFTLIKNNEFFTAKLTWTKVDGSNEDAVITSEGEGETPAAFTLKDITNNVEYTVNVENGVYTATVSTKGEYVLTEAFAPTGYEDVNAEVARFTLTDSDYDSILELKSGAKTSKGDVTLSESPSWSEKGLQNTRKTGSLSLLKLDSQSNPTTGDLIPLEGAKFELKGTSGQAQGKTYKLTTDANGTASVDKLPWGSYTLTEIEAAPGYSLKTWQDQIFEISATNLTQSYQGTADSLYNVVNEMQLDKVDDLGNAVDGAVLALYDANNTEVLEWTRTNSTQQISIKVDTTSGSYKNLRVPTGGWVIYGLPAGTYTLKEISTPADYVTAEDTQITIDARNGVVTASGDDASMTTDPEEFYTVTVKDTRAKVAVTLQKTSAEGCLVAGAQYDLYKVGTSGDTKLGTYTIGEGGTVSLGDLYVGTYYLQETKATYNTKLDSNKWSFEVTNDGGKGGKVQTTETTGEGNKNAAVNGSTVTVTNEAFNAKIGFSKVDSTDESKSISGAEFKLRFTPEGESDPLTDLIDVNEAAEGYTAENLKKGNYVLIEVSAPDGYEPVENEIVSTFTITEDDYDKDVNVSATDAIPNDPVRADFDFTKYGYINEKGEGYSVDGDATEALAGAEFTLHQETVATQNQKWDEDVVVKSDDKGQVSFTDVPEGTYTMKETATSDDNHELLDSQWTVTVYRNGNVDIDGPDINAVINDYKRAEFSFTKVAEKSDNKKVLAGAQYKLTRIANEGEQDVDVATLTTDENGKISFTGLLAHRQYRLTEVAAPDGSMVSKNPIVVAFDADGKLQLVDAGNGTAVLDEDGNLFWEEPQTDYLFLKTDAAAAALAGASLEIQDANGAVVTDAEGNALRWTSGTDAHEVTGALVAGQTYKLVETAAPSGYEVAEPIEFTVSDEAAEPNHEAVTITMVDQKTPEAANSGNDTATSGTRTGDMLGMFAIGAVVVALIAGGAALVASRKRPRGKHTR